jgi:transposase
MEALILTRCQAMTIRGVARLLAVSDMRIWRTLDDYLEGARAEEDFSTLTALGLDETAARRGHPYISLFHDLKAGRLRFACEGRKAEGVAQFADDLEAHGGCAENIGEVCIDLSASDRSGFAEPLPWAAVTFDLIINEAQPVSRAGRAWAECALRRSPDAESSVRAGSDG